MEVLKDMFPNVAEEDLVLTMKDNNFELEEAISDILIKTSPFEQAGTVLKAIEAYCSFLLNMLKTQIYIKCYYFYQYSTLL